MSRIGRKVIAVPAGVKVVVDGRNVRAEGPKGKLTLGLVDGIDVAVGAGKDVVVTRAGDSARLRAMHGTTRALLANMVAGVSAGFTRTLQLWGVGYAAEVKGRTLSLSIGYTHKVEISIPEGLAVKADRISIEGVNVWQVAVTGSDRQAVGQLAAIIRKTRPPEPYKGKGFRYEKERIIRKAGKSFQSGAAT
jgi:large subunit ribosomal protein L6